MDYLNEDVFKEKSQRTINYKEKHILYSEKSCKLLLVKFDDVKLMVSQLDNYIDDEDENSFYTELKHIHNKERYLSLKSIETRKAETEE